MVRILKIRHRGAVVVVAAAVEDGAVEEEIETQTIITTNLDTIIIATTTKNQLQSQLLAGFLQSKHLIAETVSKRKIDARHIITCLELSTNKFYSLDHAYEVIKDKNRQLVIA